MNYDLSCLVPAYNCELTLYRAVRSIVEQPGVNVQIVIQDDASTDGTLDVALGLAIKYPNVVVGQRSENKRIAETLNDAAKFATGRYIIRCDTDDWMASGCLARMAAALDNNPDITFVYGQRRYYGRRSDTYTPRPFNADDFYQHNAAGYCYMFRREVWDTGLRWRPLGTFGGRVIDLEDWQHLLAMIELGYKGMALPDTLVLHYLFGSTGTWQELIDVQPEALAELKARYPKVRATTL